MGERSSCDFAIQTRVFVYPGGMVSVDHRLRCSCGRYSHWRMQIIKAKASQASHRAASSTA